VWTGFNWLRSPEAGSCEHGDEPSGSIKDGEFPDQLSVLSASQEGLCSMELLLYGESHDHTDPENSCCGMRLKARATRPIYRGPVSHCHQPLASLYDPHRCIADVQMHVSSRLKVALFCYKADGDDAGSIDHY
jgi:hypothetical protein